MRFVVFSFTVQDGAGTDFPWQLPEFRYAFLGETLYCTPA